MLAQALADIVAGMRRDDAPKFARTSAAMQHRKFESEDAAAEYIALIKASDPEDDLVYVISAAPGGSGQFVIEIFAPDGGFVGRV